MNYLQQPWQQGKVTIWYCCALTRQIARKVMPACARAAAVSPFGQYCTLKIQYAGHAPLEDLKDDKGLGRILLHFHRAQRPTAVICHAPIALLSAKEARRRAPRGHAMLSLNFYC